MRPPLIARGLKNEGRSLLRFLSRRRSRPHLKSFLCVPYEFPFVASASLAFKGGGLSPAVLNRCSSLKPLRTARRHYYSAQHSRLYFASYVVDPALTLEVFFLHTTWQSPLSILILLWLWFLPRLFVRSLRRSLGQSVCRCEK